MIKTPLNQKVLTNVAIVRLKKGKQRFEIACYPNKVMNWHSKQEQNLDEVLQIRKIFTDVVAGEVAQKKAIQAAFKNMHEDDIIMEILNKGEFQVSEKEREDKLENLRLDIANLVVKMGVNSEDGNQFPVSIILKAMEELKYKVNTNKGAKPQALGLMNDLKKIIPIERAKMHLKVTVAEGPAQQSLMEHLEKFNGQFTVDSKENWGLMLTIDPSLFREINDKFKSDKELFQNTSIEIIEKQEKNPMEESKE